ARRATIGGRWGVTRWGDRSGFGLGAATRGATGAMTSAIEIGAADVRETVRRQGIDPLHEPAAVRRIVDRAVHAYDERTLVASLPPLGDPQEAAREVFNAIAGFGPLQKYLDDPTVEEIWINEPSKVFVARNGRSELTTTVLTADEVRDLVERMLKTTG